MTDFDDIPLAHAITLEIHRASGNELRRVSSDGLVEGKCPGCGAQPFRVVGQALPSLTKEVARSGAFCISCGDPVGIVERPMNDLARALRGETIFGAEEDRAVLEMGRGRVYG